MLDLAPNADSFPCSVMSVDFAPYLLSSSPPGSSLEFHSGHQHYPPISHGYSSQSQECEPGPCGLSHRRHGPLKPIIIKSDSDGDGDSGCTSDGECTPTSPSSPARIRKRVSFADHCGRALFEVRIMSEPSDQPPYLNPEVLASLTRGAQASVTDNPPLKLTFPQPASDYLAFRDKIDQNFVSLENVILKDYIVAGTIKVKNISFEKKVFVRYTYTSWDSHYDVQACYVPGPGDIPGRPSCYDTFTFEFEVPPTADMSKSIQFAVYFEARSCQYWDSNGGANYGIVWDKSHEPTSLLKPHQENKNDPFVFGPSSLTDFACWHHVDISTPYY